MSNAIRSPANDSEPFAFAGLWEVSTGGKEDLEALRCTIITTKPNEICAPIHNRMPVILDPEEYDAWLDPAAGDGTMLLDPAPDDWLEAVQE